MGTESRQGYAGRVSGLGAGGGSGGSDDKRRGDGAGQVNCRAILGLVLLPLVVGAAIGYSAALAWLEWAERDLERRREERDAARHTELRWMLRDTAVRGPVIETIYDG